MSLAVVTGASSGIGRATALELSRMGFHIVAAARSETRMQRVIDEIGALGGSAEYLELDLASLASARMAARSFEQTGREIDVLVNNAGVGARRGVTGDGFEIHFGVNHLGHFMFTHHLRRTFRPGTRIVQVTSSVHSRVDGIDFDHLRARSRSFFGLDEYAVSKLANVLFVREMSRRRPDWRTYAVHPGLTRTRIIPPYARPFMRRALTPGQGAETVIWCANTPELADESGGYYAFLKRRQPSPAALDDVLAAELWRRSEMWCGIPPPR